MPALQPKVALQRARALEFVKRCQSRMLLMSGWCCCFQLLYLLYSAHWNLCVSYPLLERRRRPRATQARVVQSVEISNDSSRQRVVILAVILHKGLICAPFCFVFHVSVAKGSGGGRGWGWREAGARANRQCIAAPCTVAAFACEPFIERRQVATRWYRQAQRLLPLPQFKGVQS